MSATAKEVLRLWDKQHDGTFPPHPMPPYDRKPQECDVCSLVEMARREQESDLLEKSIVLLKKYANWFDHHPAFYDAITGRMREEIAALVAAEGRERAGWPGGTVGDSDVPRFNAANVEHVEQSNEHQAFRSTAEQAQDVGGDVCGSCGSDLTKAEHDADCKFYSYGGEDGRDG